MLNVADHATHLLMQVAVASGKVSFATLQSPSEHAELSLGRAVGLPTNQWWLSANVPSEMFRLAENGALRHLGKFVLGDAGTVYAVLAQQVGPWQHRFVLQVLGKQMREYLSAACKTGFVLSLGHEGHDESLVVPDCRYLQSLQCGDVSVAQDSSDLKAIAQEACRVAVAMLKPDAVVDASLDQVRKVCVSLVVSSDVFERTAHIR